MKPKSFKKFVLDKSKLCNRLIDIIQVKLLFYYLQSKLKSLFPYETAY
jgi:hypothetical protein